MMHQHLMPVDVAGQHRGDVAREVGAANDVVGVAEGVVLRPDGGAFDAVVDA